MHFFRTCLKYHGPSGLCLIMLMITYMHRICYLTRLAIASILGPFGVHLLKFIVDTHPGSLMHSLWLLELPVRICGALPITTHTRRT